jgi:hypothetical protein
MPRGREGRLEGSCGTSPRDWLRLSPDDRLERVEAYFEGHAFDPHRHDTYALGVMLSGVQRFDYRGADPSERPSDDQINEGLITALRSIENHVLGKGGKEEPSAAS